jgi:peptidoglycan/xylan/chitin deacetylase (PgdA/CDA1 family)
MVPERVSDSLRQRVVRAAVDVFLPSNLLVRRGPPTPRRVALTFDDGPDPLTEQYLDVLDRHGVFATFFLVGKACASRYEDLLEIVRRGHEVASHGYTHRKFPNLRHHEIMAELGGTAAILPPTPDWRLVRPPQGATSVRSLVSCARAGYTTVLWSLDSDDCRLHTPDAVAARCAPEFCAPGEIILLHEGQRWTLEALPMIIDRLRDDGYVLVTLSELLRG